MKNIKHTNILRFKEYKELKTFNTFDFVCRGCTMMRYRKDIWNGYIGSMDSWINIERDNSYMTLEEEPGNYYDPNAVMVVCRGEFFGTMGYVGKEYTLDIKDILSKCSSYRLDITDELQEVTKEINLRITWISKELED